MGGLLGLALSDSWCWLGGGAPKAAPEFEVLREEIAEASLRLERDRQAFRHERALHFGTDEPFDEGDESEPDWMDEDKEVVALLRDESERLFRNLIDNVYVQDGRFDRTKLGDDLIGLIESVARVYQPESEHPLLETSVEKLLRSANRASIQLLVHLDDLPVDVKSINLREAYERVQSAAKYYGYYKKVEPYWNYARPLYHIGRIAMGANPITIGVGWAVSEVVKRGSVNVAHSYALRTFHDTVRIFGNEAAEIFGGNHRHRDAGWMFGRELVTMVADLKVSSTVREAAMRELAGAPLRSDYDRLYLFRCLSLNETVRSEKVLASAVLSLEERRTTAQRLERFVRAQSIEIVGKPGAKWKSEAEKRLGVSFMAATDQNMGPSEAVANALRSLTSFLIQFKGKDPDEAIDLLRPSEMAKQLSNADRDRAFENLSSQPPMLFELPVLDPGSRELTQMLNELIGLELAVAPPLSDFDKVIEETAGYFREDTSKWIGKYETRCKQLVASCGGDGSKLSAKAAPMIIGKLGGDALRFVYSGVSFPDNPDLTGDAYVLCGTDDAICVLDDDSGIVWSAKKGGISVEGIRQVVSNACQISGGTWAFQEWESISPARVVLPGRKMSTYAKYFGPLLDWIPEKR